MEIANPGMMLPIASALRSAFQICGGQTISGPLGNLKSLNVRSV